MFDFCSNKEKERLFCTELVKHGVDYRTALEVAKLLVSKGSEEGWTDEEIHLVEAACKQWLDQRKRIDRINSLIASSASNLSSWGSQRRVEGS